MTPSRRARRQACASLSAPLADLPVLGGGNRAGRHNRESLQAFRARSCERAEKKNSPGARAAFWVRRMSIPPPHRRPESSAGPLDYEIAQEKAAALGRLGRRLEQALAALAAFDADHPPAQYLGQNRDARVVLVETAAQALWLFLVQREACGLRDARKMMRDYRVPAEVEARAGAGSSTRPARGGP